MAGASIIVDDAVVLEAIDDLARRADDRWPLMSSIGGYLVTAAQRRIERETGPGDVKWGRLSPRTANKRVNGRARGYDHMLRVSGRLYGSLTSASDNDSAEAGTNAVYAGPQQFGAEIVQHARSQRIYRFHDKRTDRIDYRFRSRSRSNFESWATIGEHKVTIPARPFLGFDDVDRGEVIQIVADYYMEGTP